MIFDALVFRHFRRNGLRAASTIARALDARRRRGRAFAFDREVLRVRGGDLLAALPRGIDPRERVPGPLVRDANATTLAVRRSTASISPSIPHASMWSHAKRVDCSDRV